MMSSWDAEVPSSLEAHMAPIYTLLSPQEILGLEIQARSPGAEKSAGPSPPQWPCCACGFSFPGAQSCPSPPTTTCMASMLGTRASGGLTALCPQVPFPTMVALLCMWFGISLPLVYLGYYFGFRKQPYDNPVRTNQIPRQIPEQRWYMNRFVG